MNDLENYKKQWKKEQNFPKISQEEIRQMIHKKSSSIVMWILTISIIEFVMLNLIGHFISFENNRKLDTSVLDLFFKIVDYISIAISLVFIYIFYKNFKKITIYSSSKKLMRQIIKTKKTVNYYIYTNLFIIASSILIMSYFLVFDDNSFSHKENINKLFLAGVLICFLLLIISLVWLFYKLIYGLLLKKLMNNYKELKKIEHD